MRPLCVDLYCGLGGWTEGFLAEGFDVIGFDIEQHVYGDERYPAQLVLQDVRTIHGRQFKDAACIVASSPCQAYSYMAMPWSRAKQIAKALRGEGDFPDGYAGYRTIAELNALFEAPRRIQREASEAAGRWIPLVQENVKGAQPWIGPAAWHYGSFYLWGDVPALMPIALTRGGLGFNTHGERATKNEGGSWFNVAHNTASGHGQNPDGRKVGGDWFGTYAEQKSSNTISPGRLHGKGSLARKAASARIAKIPFPLAQHIARCFRPADARVA